MAKMIFTRYQVSSWSRSKKNPMSMKYALKLTIHARIQPMGT